MIQAGEKPPLRVTASLFLYLLAVSAIWRGLGQGFNVIYIYINNNKDKGTPPPCKDRLVQALPPPPPPPTFCT